MIVRREDGFYLVDGGRDVVGPEPTRGHVIRKRVKTIRSDHHASLSKKRKDKQ